MARIGICGASYQSQSPTNDAEDLVNWYLEQSESPAAKSAFTLLPSPGTKTFATLADAPGRGGIAFIPNNAATERVFAVGGSTLFEILADGTKRNLGNIGNDALPCSFAYNQAAQLLITSAGVLYCLNLDTNALGAVPGLSGAVSSILFANGYFLATLANTNKVQVSALLDGTIWTGALGVATLVIQKFAEPIRGAIVDHNQPWFYSERHALGYYNSGSSSIFDPVGDSAFIEDGLGAGQALVRADNTFFWLNANERGGGVAKRLNGATPVRISTHAVEYQWSRYPTLTDASVYAFLYLGHEMLQFRFPSANGGLGATWVYDIATGLWFRRAYWDGVNGREKSHLTNSHFYAWGRHLSTDWQSGKIYEQSAAYLDDDGNPLRRVRISPPVEYASQRVFFTSLQITAEPGLGTQDGQGFNPQLVLSWSDYDGKSWSNDYPLSAGKAGESAKRMRWLRLGSAYRRAFRLVATDPIPWRIIDEDLRANPGFGPAERVAKQYQKVT